MGITKKDRIRRLELMYAAISRATAETKNHDGEVVKTIYCGTLPELFKDIDVDKNIISRFIWAVSHKSDVLPNVLFNVTKQYHGVKIERNRYGFYKDGDKVYGNKLIPFIMEAIKEYKPEPRAVSKQDESPKICHDKCNGINLQEISDDVLTNFQYEIQKEFERRAKIHEKQARLQQVLELAEMSVDELKDLLAL